MRITDRYQSTVDRVAPAKPVTSTGKTAAAPTSSEASSSSVLDIHVSPQAHALSARAAGVEQLKASIANGTFKVDADAIAEKLVDGDE